MICLACARLRADESGALCPECGAALVSASESHLEALVQATLRRRLDSWRSDGLVDADTATRLEASLAAPTSEPVPVAVQAQAPAPVPADSRRPSGGLGRMTSPPSLRRAAGWRPG
ncbi:hypothetical protein ACLESO_22275, partial [Pyxidicoccus sp. 3LG]